MNKKNSLDLTSLIMIVVFSVIVIGGAFFVFFYQFGNKNGETVFLFRFMGRFISENRNRNIKKLIRITKKKYYGYHKIENYDSFHFLLLKKYFGLNFKENIFKKQLHKILKFS